MIDLIGIIIAVVYALGIIVTSYIIEHNIKDFNKQEYSIVVFISIAWVVFWLICLFYFIERLIYGKS